MTKLNFLRLKNALLFANIISNTVGILVIVFILRRAGDLIAPEIMMLANRIHIFFLPLCLIIPIAIAVAYEKPIRHYLEKQYRNEPVSEEAILLARQRHFERTVFLDCPEFYCLAHGRMCLFRGVLVKWCRPGVHQGSLFSKYFYRDHHRNHRIFRARIRFSAAGGEIFFPGRRSVRHGQNLSYPYKDTFDGAYCWPSILCR